MKMKGIKKSGLSKWLLIWIATLVLIISGCEKEERSNVVIEELGGGHYMDKQSLGLGLIQYGFWVECLLKNNSSIPASISDWKFQIDENITIIPTNSRSYFETVKSPTTIDPLKEAMIDLEFFFDSWDNTPLSNTKFSKEFFSRWHSLSVTVSIKDDNGYSYKVSDSSKERI